MLALACPRGEGEAHTHDAVFIDEAQDFSGNWFMCAETCIEGA